MTIGDSLINRLAVKEAALSGAPPALQDLARYHLEHALRAALTTHRRIMDHNQPEQETLNHERTLFLG